MRCEHCSRRPITAHRVLGGVGQLAVGRDAVLEAVQLPAGLAYLAASLAQVDGDTLARHLVNK